MDDNTKLDEPERTVALFDPGKVVITQGVQALMTEKKVDAWEINTFMLQHLTGNWGCVKRADKLSNEDALRNGDRIFSAYRMSTGEKLWVITTAVGSNNRRESTTILLPDEY